MKNFLVLCSFILGAIMACSMGCGDSVAGRPTPEEVEPALITYLETAFGSYDEMKITKGPDNISLGNYNHGNEGWPVYADYQATYTTNGHNMYRNSVAKMGMPMCYVIVAEGRVFCFQSKMEKRMEKMAQTMQQVIQENPELTQYKGGFNFKEQMKKSQQLQSKMREKMGDFSQEVIAEDMLDQLKDFRPGF